MRTVHVVFPVLRGTRRFIIEKGRRWSVIEHLLLDAICHEPASAVDLAIKSKLPRRVVVEAFIRLMRAGWAEIVTTPKGPMFRATHAGLARAKYDQLPAATITEPRWRGFAIEQVTGGVFRSRELDLRHHTRLPVATDDHLVVQLPGSSLHSMGELGEVFSAIEGEDELIVGVDSGAERLIERHAVVTVRDSAIEGLPSRASHALRFLILQKAKEALDAARAARTDPGKAALSPVLVDTPDPAEPSNQYDGLYDADDLIVDADAHAQVLERVIKGASERLLIHSTFVSDARAQAILPSLLQAAGRGVKIDVLWGQDDIGTSTNSSRFAAGKLQAAIAEAGRTDLISIHPFSTNSHAKIIVADNQKGNWSALVGSCNWLASDFKSFEASMRLRDPAMVGDLVRKVAGLSQGRPGVWNELAIELTVLGRRIRELPRPSGRRVPMRLLFGAEHAGLVLEARDRARQRIFALSHRIGIAAQPVALLPTLSAVKANGVDATFYYGRTTGPLSGVAGADLAREFAREGLAILPVHRPRLHAKVLGWDDDIIAVSSLNWLSADPAESTPYREIGVLVEAPKIADNFIRRFELAKASQE
jgi:phosphatidylserine/phosphatidylglycerophosphate/cardiolipin synthase-like enzyme